MSNTRVAEYRITYMDFLKEEFVTRDKEKADRVFIETNKSEICQYYKIYWVLVDGEWVEDEDFEEVFYTNAE